MQSADMTPHALFSPKRIALFGATGTVGHATARALRDAGHQVVALGRRRPNLPGVESRRVDVLSVASIINAGFSGDRFDAVVSCLASRSARPEDIWAIDHRANINLLSAAKTAHIRQFVVLSSISVQKPQLQLHFAKRAFEEALIQSGLAFSIIRPTQLFDAFDDQISKLRSGKPFLVFGDGALTQSKPISRNDLAKFIAATIANPERYNKVLPIGGAGLALTPCEIGTMLFQTLERPERFRHISLTLFDSYTTALRIGGWFNPALSNRYQNAKTTRYNATESPVLWDAQTEQYDPAATPETGSDQLIDYLNHRAAR